MPLSKVPGHGTKNIPTVTVINSPGITSCLPLRRIGSAAEDSDVFASGPAAAKKGKRPPEIPTGVEF